MKLKLDILQNYLAFGLEVTVQQTNDSFDDFKGTLTALRASDSEAQVGSDFYPLSCIIPHVRPLSSLTNPITHNGKELVPIVELAKIAFPSGYDFYKMKLYIDHEMASAFLNLGNDQAISLEYNYRKNCFYSMELQSVKLDQLKLFQWLYLHHFDLHGLHDANLAIAKDSLNEEKK